MAKKYLSEDEIKYIVSADSSTAQKEIHALTQETKELKKEERERRKMMVELEAQGKKNTDEYRRLKTEVKSYTEQISKNNEKMALYSRQLDINAMSMRDLKKRAKELTAELEDMSEAANPEAYAELSNQLGSVRRRMDDLKNKGKNISSEFGSAGSMLSKWKMAIKGFIAVKLVGYLVQLNSAVYSIRKEFAKYEAVLRNTFQSQEKAVRSMKMLQQLAADTPASLKEWTEAYIKLVNRGIKPTSDELTNMGDLAASQGKSVDQLIEAILDAMTGENERLKEFGIKAAKSGETTKFTFRGVTTEVKNSEQAIKDYLLSLGQLEGVAGSMAVQMQELEGLQSNFGDTVDSILNRIGKKLEPFYKRLLRRGIDFFSTIDKLFTSHTEVYENHLDQLVKLESTVPQLMLRYEDLRSKTDLNNAEQKELANIISQITSLIPGAASAFDDYGHAIALSGDKVDEFLKKQKALLLFENKKAISELEKQKEDYKRIYEDLQKQHAQGGRTVFVSNGMFSGYTSYIDKSVETVAKIEADLKKYGDLILGVEEKLKKINGQALEDAVQKQKDMADAKQRFTKMNKSMLSAWLKDEKNAADQYREIAQEVYDARFPKANTTDDKSDPNAVALKNLESTHNAEINQIRLAGQEKQQAESEINLAILKSDQAYYEKRIAALEKFKKNEKKSSKQAEYQNQIVTAKSKLLDIEVNMEKQAIAGIEKMREEDLAKEKATTDNYRIIYTKSLSDKKITKEQHDMLMSSLDVASTETRLAIEQRYLNDVNDLELKNGQLKADAVKKANIAVMAADQDAANARAAQQQKLNDLIKDFKSQFKVTTVDEDYEAQKRVLEASYRARLEMAKEKNLDSTKLTEAYYRAQEQLEMDHQQRIQSIKDQYGISTQQERFNAELAQLRSAHEQGYLEEEEYQEGLTNLKLKWYKKQFDYYSNLFSGAIQALQQAEIANVDARYDAEIAAAQGNAEEVERLETEKAQKKLDIEKKYADVKFAIKASQIAADTAMAIIETHASLGGWTPWAIAAAALMGITGAAQLAAANAERQKVKSMTLSGSSSSSNKGGARVATGRQEGGKIDVRRAQDGKLFPGADYDPDARGFIDRPTVIVGEGPVGQSREWVASNAAVENPTVAPILNLLDQAQQAGTIRTLDLNQVIRARMAGFSSGGSVDKSLSVPTDNSNPDIGVTLPPELMRRLAMAVISIEENGVSAPIVLSEIDKKRALLERSRSIGSKND
nr:MAG TPA: tail tape measure [Caudoviricetes sp.]